MPNIHDSAFLQIWLTPRTIFAKKLHHIQIKQLPQVFKKKDVLKDFAKLTGKHLYQSLFFDKVASLSPATL